MNLNKSVVVLLATFILLFPLKAAAFFTDVSTNNAQYEAIKELYDTGIVKGYADGTFKPDQFITKAEFYKMVFNHIGYNPPQSFNKTLFTDVPDGSWFSAYVKKALDLAVISYNPEDLTFRPSLPVTRIEGLKLIFQLEGIPAPFTNDTTLIFPDIKDDYTYRYLVQAAQKTGIYLSSGTYFFTEKLLTRGETAELLFQAKKYREENGIPVIQVQLSSSGVTTENATLLNNPKFPIFLNVWNKINEQYLNKDTVNSNDLIYGAIDGMVKSLNDQYSTFESPETAVSLENSLNGTYEGIGTVMDTYNGQYIVIAVIEGSPAETAGIKPGDIILKVDGKTASDYSITDLINLIKGEAGTYVYLTVKRDSQTLSIKVQREKITLDTVIFQTSSVQIPKSIGYIAIQQFTGTTEQEFEQALEKAMAENPKGLILDLRDNPGGYVDSAYSLLNHFVEKGEIIVKIKTPDFTYDTKSEGNGDLAKLPVVVLVNKNTASAAEIVAGALRDDNKAQLIGEQTYGKGTVQEVDVYNDGSLLKLSIAKWLTPNSTDINHIGIKPDILVAETKDDVLGKTDSQLQKAVDYLQTKI